MQFNPGIIKGRNSPTSPSTLFISPHTLLSQTVLFYHYHMYGTLAYSKLLRCLAHCRFMLNNIIRNLYRPLFNIIFHIKPLHSLFLQCMQGRMAICGINIFKINFQFSEALVTKILLFITLFFQKANPFFLTNSSFDYHLLFCLCIPVLHLCKTRQNHILYHHNIS